MLNFGVSKPRVKGGARAPRAPLDLHLIVTQIPFKLPDPCDTNREQRDNCVTLLSV